MTRPTKRQQQIKRLPRKRGRFIHHEDNEPTNEIGEVEKFENIEETINEWTEGELREFEEVGRRLISEVLKWDKGAMSKIRAVYTGTSRTTLWRQKKEKKKLEEHAKEIKKMNDIFQPVFEDISISNMHSSILPLSLRPITYNSPSLSIDAMTDLRMRLEELNQQCSVGKSLKDNSDTFTYEYIRLLSIRRFIQQLLDGQGKMVASNQIAQIMWNKGDYMARCIRKWSDHFVRTGELPVYYQGKHMKLESLLDDEDFNEGCQAWLRQQVPETRSPRDLKMYIEGTLFPKLIGHIKKDTISEKTCRNYMHLWGYRYDERRKGIYYDGHERSDVIEYRNKWLERMFRYKKSMKEFDSDTLDVVLEPQLEPGEKEIVQITHDECHFYANDGRRRIWIGEEEDILRPKHMGRSIMVSAFLCPCHGLLKLSDEQMQMNPHIKHKNAYVLRSIQTDGYWTLEHMMEQVRAFFLLFNFLRY
jgi:hypothetical protein